MSYLAELDQSPVGARTDARVLRARIAKPLSRGGLPAKQVISELVADVDGGLHAVASGRFFAWVMGGSLPAALAADWLTSAWDQNAHTYGTGPALAVTCWQVSMPQTLGRLMDISGSMFHMIVAMPSSRILRRMPMPCRIAPLTFLTPQMCVINATGIPNGRAVQGDLRVTRRSGSSAPMDWRR